jgi:hypothetical protein
LTLLAAHAALQNTPPFMLTCTAAAQHHLQSTPQHAQQLPATFTITTSNIQLTLLPASAGVPAVMLRPTFVALLGLLVLVPPGLAAPLKYVDDYWLRGRASW